MDLSIITVTWNSGANIAEQIKSVQAACAGLEWEEYVVDNGSTDNTTSIVGAIHELPLHLIANKKNVGFGAANNQAAVLAQGEFLLFLNPDMRLKPGSLEVILAWMKAHPDVGIAGCTLIDESGKLNRDATPRRLPGLFDQAAIILKLPHIFPQVLKRYLFEDFNADVEQEVDSLRGAFMLMRRELYTQLGWAFDPRYYIWFEDVDTCREAIGHGWKVMYTPIIQATDYVAQSFKQRTTLWKQKQYTQSMLAYFKKWEPWYKWVVIAALRPLGIFMAWVNDKIQQVK